MEPLSSALAIIGIGGATLLYKKWKEKIKKIKEREDNKKYKNLLNQEKEINKLYKLIEDYEKYDLYLDNKKKKEVIKKFDPVNIPEVYKKFKIRFSNSFYQRIDKVYNFKRRTNSFVDEYNDIFYTKEKKRFEKLFKTIEKNPLTDEQQLSVITDEENTLVVAGAGSGKTSSIVAKTAYLIIKGICLPKNILVLAYNKNASEELKERIYKRIKNNKNINKKKLDSIEIRTFHSFGSSIITKVEKKPPSVSKLAEDFQFKNFVKKNIDDLLLDKKFGSLLMVYFISYLKPYKNIFEFENIGEYFDYLKSHNITITLKGDNVKSFEECEIANFLYINQIKYEYEKNYEFDTSSYTRRQYKPDFYLTDYKIYIEHFGIDKDGNPPIWFKNDKIKMDDQSNNYKEQIIWKENLHKEKKTKLIKTYSYEKSDGLLLKNLKNKLLKNKVELKPMSKERILDELNDKGKVTELSNLICTFLNHYKSNELNIDKIKIKSKQKPQEERCLAFIDIFQIILNRYQDELETKKEIDFNDMIIKSRNLLQNNIKKTFFSHVIIDEFQDISSARYKLINALRELNPEIKFFCVGDDWQSIYRFADSELLIMLKYKDYFDGYTEKKELSNTFRFSQPLADLSTKFICQNPNQIKKNIKAQKNNNKPSVTICFDDSNQEGLEKVLKEIKKITDNKGDKKILILGRYNHNINEKFMDKHEKKKLNKRYPKFSINFKTIHGSKGLEEDYIIILDVNTAGIQSKKRLGFPSEMVDDPLLELVMGEEDKFEHAEERRLFYVALTRARKHVYLVTDPSKQSSFVRELTKKENNYLINKLDADKISELECKNCKTGWLIKRIPKNNKNPPFYSCSNYPLCDGKAQICNNCKKGIYIENKDSFYYECSNHDCKETADRCRKCGDVLTERDKRKNKKTKEPFYSCDCGETQNLKGINKKTEYSSNKIDYDDYENYEESGICKHCGASLTDKNILDGMYGEFYKCFECEDTQDLDE